MSNREKIFSFLMESKVIQQINEADYMRFLKKNPKLSSEEAYEINKFFSKENPQAGSKIDWQSRDVRSWDYDKFEQEMLKYKSGFRKKMIVKIPGKQGEDYWTLRLKNKDFIANIPLNQETATFLNSGKYGNCGTTNYCIGWAADTQYWRKHVKGEGKVPIYIIDGYDKWVVMIKLNNKDYEVWDKFNKTDTAYKGANAIPGFDIKKELFTSQLKKLYDHIRDEFLRPKYKGSAIPKDVLNDAIKSYEHLAADITYYGKQLINARDEWYEEMDATIKATIEDYEEEARLAEEEAMENVGQGKQMRNLKDRVDSFRFILKAEPNGTGTDPKTGEPIWHIRGTEPSKSHMKRWKDQYMNMSRGEVGREGIPYTRKELQAFIDMYDEKMNSMDHEEPDFSERDSYLEIVDRLKSIENVYDVLDGNQRDWSDIEWHGNGIYEYEESYDIYPPRPDDHHYDEYYEFLQEYYDQDIDRDSSLDEIYYHVDSYQESDGYAVLDALDLPNPNEVAENWTPPEEDE